MAERCAICGSLQESSIHSTTSKNVEIRMASHVFEPDDYVAWLCFVPRKDNPDVKTLRICDSDTPDAFRVYRRREP